MNPYFFELLGFQKQFFMRKLAKIKTPKGK